MQTFFKVVTPIRGKRTKGKRAMIPKGAISVIHQEIIQKATPSKPRESAGSSVSSAIRDFPINKVIATRGPSQKIKFENLGKLNFMSFYYYVLVEKCQLFGPPNLLLGY